MGEDFLTMVTFPVSLIPTLFVPLFLLFHTLTFKRIADVPAQLHANR